ncbi:hypothetical protein F6453_0150 [Marinobacter nauticus]|uniref:Uncharacterized protein n=1 Tax=Marinobacter nauticus TaxID=2743 RepID=A0A833JT20_MARNT|nr:hypothetical protein F6453_0150 [Marinobacter nauticus]
MIIRNWLGQKGHCVQLYGIPGGLPLTESAGAYVRMDNWLK